MSRTASSPLIAASIVFSLLLGGFALTPSLAATRTSEAEKNTEHYIELVRRDLRQERRELIAEAMNLTKSEANAFWPVYQRYEAELNRLGDEKLALINDYADNHKTMTDAPVFQGPRPQE